MNLIKKLATIVVWAYVAVRSAKGLNSLANRSDRVTAFKNRKIA